MWNKLKALFEFSARTGLFLPMAFDNDKEGASVTLFFSHVSFCLTLISIIYLFFKPDVLSPAISSMMLFAFCILVYRLRRLDDVEIDLDDRSIKLKGHDDQEKEK